VKRIRTMAPGKEGRMNTSRFFFAGILWMSLLAPGALPQATDNQAALVKQSSIIIAGTVSEVAATSFAGVPKSAQTIVVHVDSVLKKPAAVSLKKGDSVTVEVKDPSAFQVGTQATFYTDGWIFGSGVAVKELGHEILPSGGTSAAAAGAVGKTFGQLQQETSDQDLQRRVATADYVVTGHITDVHLWKIPKSAAARYRTSEHSANWHEAVLQIQSILKGPKVKRNKMIVRFPQSRDVAWVNAPKFEKTQQGIFLLQKDQVSGDPKASLGGYTVDAYTCLKPGDWLPMTDEARVRSLLKK
jgi:hypothetical protein